MFALGALGAGAYAVVRAIRRGAARNQQLDVDAFLSDLEEPVVVTEEVIVVSEAAPYEMDMEMMPEGQQDQNVESSAPSREPPR
jgi:hypothetical protein